MWGAIARGVGGALVGEVAVNLALNTTGFKKDVNNTVKGTEKSFGSAFGKIGKWAAVAFATKVVVDFGKASVQAASEAQSAWTGLYSIPKQNRTRCQRRNLRLTAPKLLAN